MTDSESELSQAERDAVAALHREAPPPQSLEDATVEALERRGLLAARGNPARRLAWTGAAIAASLAMFGAGLALGGRSPAAPPESGSSYLMLLYEGSSYAQPARGHESDRVHEYARWARAGRRQGEVLRGEKLRDKVEVVGNQDGALTSPHAPERLTGFFIIRAADRRAALEIARSCPHVHYGGTVVLREIDPT